MLGPFFLLILATLVACKTAGEAQCDHQGYQLIKGIFGRETHWLCIRHIDIGQMPLASESAAILLDPDAMESDNALQGYPLQDFTMAYGYPVSSPKSGSAEGYIGDDNHFYGVLHLSNRTLYADPYGNDLNTRKYVAFEHGFGGALNGTTASGARPRRQYFDEQVGDVKEIFNNYIDPHNIHFPYRIEERKRTPGIARARVCDLLLLADKEFYENDANSSLSHAVRRMMHAVAQADLIFRNTDFNEDGFPDNIGFSVKYVLVLTSNVTNQRVFGNLLSEKIIDGRQYLMKFARIRRLSEVCLGVAFSGHGFHNRTLGLSFTSLGNGMGGSAGGLCDRRAYGRSFNTLAIAHRTQDDQDRIPENVAALTLAHEMGHSFGAHHDDNFPNPECRDFLMGSQSTSAENSRHFEFSICSKRLIAATLNSMSYCLTAEDRPFCGNGIVEEGEACDCGMPSICHRQDPCCTPRAGGALVYEEGTLHVAGCSVAPTALCHPSQGLCCTTQCKHKDLIAKGIDCTTLDHECNCVNINDCKCSLGGRCLPDRTCHAAECSLLGLRECKCQKRGPGGKISEEQMCGVCCQVADRDGRNECVGAEIAVKIMQENGYPIPSYWPDPEYQGPNVTLNVCNPNNVDCREVALRAWRAGDACVALGVVGLCSFTGVCKPKQLMPRSNVYPIAMRMQAMRAAPPGQKLVMHSVKAMNESTTPKLNLLIFTVTYYLVVRRLF